MKNVVLAGGVVLCLAFFSVFSPVHASEIQNIQALPASTSTQGLGVISQFFSQVFDQWKRAQTMAIPQVSDIEQGISQKSLVVSTTGAAKLTDAVITEIGGDWFSVQVWGIALKVQITGKTLFSLGRISQWSFLEMNLGDHVDVLGSVDPETGMIVASTVNGKVRTQTATSADFALLQQKIEALLKRAQDLLSSMRQSSSTAPSITP